MFDKLKKETKKLTEETVKIGKKTAEVGKKTGIKVKSEAEKTLKGVGEKIKK